MSGSEGDAESIKTLSKLPSAEATFWLEKLAQNSNAFADSRAEAVRALGSKPSIDLEVFSGLLRIDQPFVVRHASVEVIKQHGCNDVCVAAVLYSLHSILLGQQTLEMQLSADLPKHGVRPDPPDELAKLRDRAERDYMSLLNTNPCMVRDILVRNYSSERAFVDHIQTALSPCA